MRIVQTVTAISLIAIPSLLTLLVVLGSFPLRFALITGTLTAVIMVVGRIVAIGERIKSLPAHSFLWSFLFFCLCATIVFSMWHAPAISDYITETAHSGALLLIPYMIVITCSALTIQSELARLRLIRSVLISMALVPMVMLIYDASSGNAMLYLNQWIAGLRVLNTGLVASANVNALVGAAGALASLWLVIEAKQRVFVAGIGAGVFYLLISRSQGVAISASISGILMILPTVVTVRRMRFAIVIWLISAPVQIDIYSSLNGTAIGDMFTRSEASDQGVGTGRTLIWKAAIEEMESKPLKYVLGTGYMSAASTSVITAIEQAIKPDDAYDLFQHTYTLHNAALQYLFDTGLIGISLLVSCLWRAVSKIATYSNRLNAIMLYFLISGLNEAIGAPYATVLFLPFLALIGMNAVGGGVRRMRTRLSFRAMAIC